MINGVEPKGSVVRDFLWQIKNRFFSSRSKLMIFRHKLWDELTNALMLVIFAYGVNFFLFYIFKVLWGVYGYTPVGTRYAKEFPQAHNVITTLLRDGTWSFWLEVVLASFVICLIVAAASQFLLLARFLYHSRDFIGKLLLWGLPLTIGVAWFLMGEYHWRNWYVAVSACIIPTLLMFNGCFAIVNELVPELHDLIHKALAMEDDIVGTQMPRARAWLHDFVKRINNAG